METSKFFWEDTEKINDIREPKDNANHGQSFGDSRIILPDNTILFLDTSLKIYDPFTDRIRCVDIFNNSINDRTYHICDILLPGGLLVILAPKKYDIPIKIYDIIKMEIVDINININIKQKRRFSI